MKQLLLKYNQSIKIIVLAISLMLAASSVLFLASSPAFAETPAELACKGAGGTYDTSTGTCDTGGASLVGKGGLMQKVINVLLFIVGAIAVVMVIVGGIRYVISSGDQNAVTAAKNTILYAVIGLVIAVLAYALVGFITGSLAGGGSPPAGGGGGGGGPTSTDSTPATVSP